jgi:chromosome segregation ATPase
MKRRIVPALGPTLGIAAAAAGCVATPAPVIDPARIETASIATAAPATGDTDAIRREIAALRSEVRRIARERSQPVLPPQQQEIAQQPVESLRADVERLNAVIATLQDDIAKTRQELAERQEASVGDAARGERHAAEIADLRRRIERTNALLLEVAQSLAGRPRASMPVKAGFKPAN